ncbi:pyruvate formate-lyase-activating protein [Clostridium aminobutyricum]|uniref:Pyruvate formate-lyase-activating enzyme n=1 Tax=Clostridium aminobutyricum TaxID=33953 RepID=A0A939DA40_CLOAM|nr:pyruvate formate-lyase-activating protein [Clostridium aminobutyricum]MBN7774016.1 pyruvate formate lyase-activating protein [Clostridium aminobutyricum]
MIKGRLHSFETFGAVDGPGIRTVVFLQGCPARCIYCHNPDSWNPNGGREVDTEEIVKVAKRAIPYYGEEGGVTFSGGEPLVQGEFLIQTMRALKAEGINSIIDTSATYIDEYTETAISECQMILLDIKHSDPNKFKDIAGKSQDPLLEIIDLINKHRKPVWVRQVIVPGINDTEENIKELNEFIKKIKRIDKVELLPYHTMASDKYEKLGLSYRLKDVGPMDKEKVKHLSSFINY